MFKTNCIILAAMLCSTGGCRTSSSRLSTNQSKLVYQDKITTWFHKAKQHRGDNTIFVYIPFEFTMSKDQLNLARIGISKSINSMAYYADDVVSPIDVSEGNGFLYAINLESYWGKDAKSNWSYVATPNKDRCDHLPQVSCYFRDDKNQTGTGAHNYFLDDIDSSLPISADRFAYNLTHARVYMLIFAPPYLFYAGEANEPHLSHFKMSNASHEKYSPSENFFDIYGIGEPTHRLMVNNPISFSPRYIERRPLKNWQGSYWSVSDNFYSVPADGGDYFKTDPYKFLAEKRLPRFQVSTRVDRRTRKSVEVTNKRNKFGEYQSTAEEGWLHMKNGLPAYFIWGGENQARLVAEPQFVTDFLHLSDSQNHLMTGQCGNCHVKGVQSGKTSVWDEIAKHDFSPIALEMYKNFFSSQRELDSLYYNDWKIIYAAYKKIVSGVSTGGSEFNNAVASGMDNREPVYFLIQKYTNSFSEGRTLGLKKLSWKNRVAIKSGETDPRDLENAKILLTDVMDVYKSRILSHGEYTAIVSDVIENNCQNCHAWNQNFIQNNGHQIAEAVVSNYMPPEKSDQLTIAEKRAFLDWSNNLYPKLQ